MTTGRSGGWGLALILVLTAVNTVLLFLLLRVNREQVDARVRAEAEQVRAEVAAARAALAAEVLDTASLPSQRALAARLVGRGGQAARTGRALELACLHAEGRVDEALRLGNESLGSGETPWLRWRLALALLARRQAPEAVGELERVVRALPDFPAAHHRLGAAYALAGRQEDALGALEVAVKAGAGPAAALDYARVLVAAGRYADAPPHLEAFLSVREGHAEALRLLAMARFHLDKPREAATLYERSWQARPEARTLVSAAIAWRRAGDQDRALALLDQALPAAAGLPEVRFERAGLLLDLGRRQEGLAELRHYLAMAQGRPDEASRIEAARGRLEAAAPAPPAAPAAPAASAPR